MFLILGSDLKIQKYEDSWTIVRAMNRFFKNNKQGSHYYRNSWTAGTHGLKQTGYYIWKHNEPFFHSIWVGIYGRKRPCHIL